MGAIKVRVANPADYPDLARIYANTIFAGFPAHQRAALVTGHHVALAAENTVLLVAEAFGTVVGGIGISGHKNHLTPNVEDGELQVFWCGVEPEWQGKGIGRLLISSVITSLRNSTIECTRLVMQILETRHTAIRLAEASGAVRNPSRGGMNEDADPYQTFEIDVTSGARKVNDGKAS
ncbi:GNAT family N-acetyltransferase [Paenarthrobacter nitroguajacolicus]|uniref:GNAT family N-acetyltransferase n=1 Tax=Paenarthrobacter nitroguajacolicus TaxID=211146 RepID=UPI000A7FA325|nr:GNAT family N-acetyltransferase [Paenarthrobacter nitroguajacolicus]